MNFLMNVFLLDRESKFISLSLSGGKTISLDVLWSHNDITSSLRIKYFHVIFLEIFESRFKFNSQSNGTNILLIVVILEF